MDERTQQAPRLNITPDVIKNAQNIKCPCGSLLFTEKIIFKRVSAILSPSGREEVIPMPVIICDKCGKIPDTFDPQNLIPKELKVSNEEVQKPAKEEKAKGLKVVK